MVRKCLAYTMVELLVVISILLVLAGIAASVLPKAARSATMSRSLGEMRQIALAVRLYVDEWEAIPTAKSASTVGSVPWFKRFGVPQTLFRGCGLHPNSDLDYSVLYFFITDYLPYEAWIAQYGDRLPACFDMNCSEPTVRPTNVYESKLGLAVSLEVTALKRRALGSPYMPEFWIGKP